MKHLLKQGLNRITEMSGFKVVSSDYLQILESQKHQTFSYHLKSLIDRLQIDCVLDVGANTGQYQKFLRQKVGYQGLILSFEPIQKNLKILQQKANSDPMWFIYGYALGSQEQHQVINVMKETVFSSFLEPDHSQIEDFQTQNTIATQEEVWVKTLDSLLPSLTQEYSFNRIFLKLDTQGYDLEVIKGATLSLSCIQALQTEVSFKPLYHQIPSFLETYQTLTEKGFDLTGLFPVVKDSSLRMIEGDCVMVNRFLVGENLR